MLEVKTIPVSIAGSDHITNCYIAYDTTTNEGILIDPGDEADKILDLLDNYHIKIQYIVITHGHADHMGALEEVVKKLKVKIVVHSFDKNALLYQAENYTQDLGLNYQNIDEANLIIVEDNQILKIGNISFQIVYTPGHTKGGICLFEEESKSLFTGDTLFSDCYGRCDLYQGNLEDMTSSLNRLFKLSSSVQIYPGHGPSTTIENAKKHVKLLYALKGRKLE